MDKVEEREKLMRESVLYKMFVQDAELLADRNARTMLRGILREWSLWKMREKYWESYDLSTRRRHLDNCDILYIYRPDDSKAKWEERGYAWSGEHVIHIPDLTTDIASELLTWIHLRCQMMKQQTTKVRVGSFVEEGHVAQSVERGCRRKQVELREKYKWAWL